jgi:hypothetical protein
VDRGDRWWILPVMVYDEQLAARVRVALESVPGVTERRMFGGLAFVVNGHMAVSASAQGGLLLRCDPADTDDLTETPHASGFEMRGREMDGWLRVGPGPSTTTPSSAGGWASASPTSAPSPK